MTQPDDTTAKPLPVRDIGFKRPQKTGLALLMTRPEAGALVAAVAVFIFFSLFAEHFLTGRIFANIFLLTAELGLVAIGVTLLMIAGEFDLSVGSVLGLASGICIMMLNAGTPAIVAILVTLGVAGLIGAMNGFLVTRLRIHSLIITLGAMMFYRAMVLVLTKGFPLRMEDPDPLLQMFAYRITFFTSFSDGVIIPVSFIWLLLAMVVFGFLLNSTQVGNWVFATGGAGDAAREMGVPTKRVKVMMFTIVSVFAAFAGIVQMARFNSIDALRGDGMELEAVLAVVVGGASLNGGYGSVIGAVLGVLMLAMIKQGLILMGIEAYWYRAGIGLVLILAAIVNQYVRERNA